MMKHPVHPGTVLKEAVFEPLGLSVSEAAERLSMSRPALSRVLNCHAGISPDLAIRLETAGVSQARFWLNMQVNYELAQARKHRQPSVITIQAAEAA